MGVEWDNAKSSKTIKRGRKERHGERGRHTTGAKGKDRVSEGERE